MSTPPIEAGMKRVLTIAGSDSGGGAGIQADLKTCAALGCFGMTAITAITAQNTLCVTAVHEVPAPIVRAQIDAVMDDIGADAVKTGMLASAAIVETVAESLKKHHAKNVVIDPVMVSKSGAVLLNQDAISLLKQALIPLATMLCPNIPEAEALTGFVISNERDIGRVLRALHDLGPCYVLLKGGHLHTKEATDYLFDGINFERFPAPRIPTKHTHGTGCTFAAAVACFLARNAEPSLAVRLAKNYLFQAISEAHKLAIGHGIGPVHHGWNLELVSGKD